MSDTAIKIHDLSKMYRLYSRNIDRLKEAVHPFKKKYHHPFYALKNVNLTVEKGEILGIIGRNGAGKSTLLKIITGVITQTGGSCAVKGRISPLLGLAVGFNPELTGLENIYMTGTIRGYSRKQIDEKLDEIISFADIGEYIHQPTRTYSSGMSARLSFAVAINIDPEILILDEVLSVGDELFKRKCYAKMEELFNSGCTVLYVSHSTNEINRICSRAILLNRGELVLDGSPILVTRHYHEYLDAAPENQNKILAGIRKLNRDVEKKKKFGRQLDQKTEEDKQKKEKIITPIPAVKEPGLRPEAYYIPSFKPKSTKIQKFYDVEIFDVGIQTLSGTEVNALIMDEIYMFSYKVKFDLDLEDVRFSVLIQNEKNLEVSGFKIPWGNEGESLKVKKGETYLIKNKFKCIMLPDNYYLGISVTVFDEKKGRVPATRVNDAAVFKVQQEKNLSSWGVVRLEHSDEIIKIT